MVKEDAHLRFLGWFSLEAYCLWSASDHSTRGQVLVDSLLPTWHLSGLFDQTVPEQDRPPP